MNVRDNDNYLYIEHFDRHDKNTQVDHSGNVMKSSCLFIKDIKINRVKFYASIKNKRNIFLPTYDDRYIEWLKKQETENKIMKEMDASPTIGINGKFRLHFKWPLHLHGLYFFDTLL